MPVNQRSSPVSLSETNRRLLDTWRAEFERSWEPGRLAVWARRLPPGDSPLRLAALLELSKIDQRQHFQRGRQVLVEAYLADFPELAGRAGLVLDLVLHEFELRRELGLPADLADFARRFPSLAAGLRRRVGRSTPSPLTPPATPPPNGPTIGPPPASTPAPDQSARTTGPLPEMFGRYRIVRLLGEGGMGAVYLAHDTQLDRPVALKVPHFKADDGPEILERFYREARSAALLHHPNLCAVYDVGCINGMHYLTMAYIEGQALTEFIKEGKLLPQRQVAAIVRKIALGLGQAHAQGVVHRDLKPANVLVNSRDEPVVMDFGLARRTGFGDVQLTRAGTMVGTPAYMAPEGVRADSQAVGPRSDIYSLGIILYELLTGQLPFEGPPLAVLAQILTQPVPGPRDLRPDVDAPLDAICRKAMGKEPAHRYASMEEFAAALADYLRGGDGVPGKVFDDSLGMEPAEVARSSGSNPAAPGTPGPPAPPRSGPQHPIRAAPPPPQPPKTGPGLPGGPALLPRSLLPVVLLTAAGFLLAVVLILTGLWVWSGRHLPFGGSRPATPTAPESKK
jgi:serine/threonine protein kinase